MTVNVSEVSRTIVATNDLGGAGCDSHGASVRVDDMSDVRDFLAEHIPGVSKGKLPPEEDRDGGSPPAPDAG